MHSCLGDECVGDREKKKKDREFMTRLRENNAAATAGAAAESFFFSLLRGRDGWAPYKVVRDITFFSSLLLKRYASFCCLATESPAQGGA